MSTIAVRGPVPRLSGLAAPLLAALMLTGCHVSTALGGSSGAPRASPNAAAMQSATSTSSPATSSAAPVAESEHPPSESGLPQRPDQAMPLAGYSVEEATRRARARGFHGRIEISHLTEFDPACKPATVCGVIPWYWEADPPILTLYINHEITITPPPN